MDAVTVEDSFLCFIRLDHFRKHVFSRMDEIGLPVIRCLIKKIAYLLDIIDDLAFFDVETRLLKTLSRLSSKNNECIRLSHQDLAEMVGTAREVVSRSMAFLKKSGIITHSSIKGFKVDSKRLKELIGD